MLNAGLDDEEFDTALCSLYIGCHNLMLSGVVEGRPTSVSVFTFFVCFQS